MRRKNNRKRVIALVLILLITTVSIVAGTVLFRQNPFHPKAPVYQLDIGYTGGNIGTLTISGDTYRNIDSQWFNLTLWGNEHYVIQFPYYVQYAGEVSKTAYVYLVYNVSVVFSPGERAAISLSTQDPSPSPYQQSINVSSSVLPSIDASFSDLVFQYGNGTSIYAWLENVSDGSALIWLRLWTDVNQTVYMTVTPGTSQFSGPNGTYGEAPQLSATYGQYDNGAKVFTDYWNFSGTSLPAGWSVNDGGTVTVSNGVTVTANAGTEWNRGGLGYNIEMPSAYAAEALVKEIPGTLTGNFAIFPFVPDSITTSTTYTTLYIDENRDGWAYQNPKGSMPSSGFANNQVLNHLLNHFAVYSYFVNGTSAFETANYTSPTSTNSGYTSTTYIGFGSVSDTEHAYWVRVRGYPSGGVMPSYTITGAGLGSIYV